MPPSPDCQPATVDRSLTPLIRDGSPIGPVLAVTGDVFLLLSLLLLAFAPGGEAGVSDPDPYVTALVRAEDLPPELVSLLLQPEPGEVCDCVVFPVRSFVITDRRSNIERLLRHLVPSTPDYAEPRPR
jgi:hypothetical protein